MADGKDAKAGKAGKGGGKGADAAKGGGDGSIVLPFADDFHVHLRQGDMMKAVVLRRDRERERSGRRLGVVSRFSFAYLTSSNTKSSFSENETFPEHAFIP